MPQVYDLMPAALYKFRGWLSACVCGANIDFQIKLLGALSVGDVRTGTIPSLLPSQKHYLKVYSCPTGS
ncbi:MAG: hypothetical protein V1736_12900 [Pseudomonadota bacterium]